jgi:SAM-dependent methyltransferase
MSALADSEAFRDSARVLPQHQFALMTLQQKLSHPILREVRWLDIGCGRGQILEACKQTLSMEARSRLAYSGGDVNDAYVCETRRIAESLKFSSVEVITSDVWHLNKLLKGENKFDFITNTNVLHEIPPKRVPEILVDAVLRLSPDGSLFVYDMERPPQIELGAIPWTRDEFRQIVSVMLAGLGVDTYKPEVGRWTHRTTSTWNVELQRAYFAVCSDELEAHRDSTVAKMLEIVERLLLTKRDLLNMQLKVLATSRPETGDESQGKEALACEFWSISHALESWA